MLRIGENIGPAVFLISVSSSSWSAFVFRLLEMGLSGSVEFGGGSFGGGGATREFGENVESDQAGLAMDQADLIIAFKSLQ